MPKKIDKSSKRSLTKVDKARNNELDKFFELSEKARKHIQWSLQSVKLCVTCTIIYDENTKEAVGIKPGKAKDEEGKCKFCHNTGYVPDENQRNWAAKEILSRTSPVPKAVELETSEKQEGEEFEKDFNKLSKEEIDKKLEALGVTFGTSRADKETSET
jgi:hypothetical protein